MKEEQSMVTITVQGTTAQDAWEELRKFATHLHQSSGESEKPAQAKTEKNVKDKEKAAPSPQPPAKVVAEVVLADIQTVIPKLVEHVGRKETVAILGRFGAKTGKDVKPDQFVEFMIVANAALAGPKYEPPTDQVVK
jgi:hypothetical protein